MTEAEDDAWRKTFRAFRRIAAKEGLCQIAPKVPAHQATIYRLVDETTAKPSLAIRQGIERIVREHEER